MMRYAFRFVFKVMPTCERRTSPCHTGGGETFSRGRLGAPHALEGWCSLTSLSGEGFSPFSHTASGLGLGCSYGMEMQMHSN